MAIAFIIMQIGNPEMDAVCRDAIVPAVEACGLEAKRVDKHNEGQLLNSAIARFINQAEIVVADLTNERPNCYLEVGLTMGIDKFEHLILCARSDHFQDNPNYRAGGPKVHFDLGGYDILQWDADKIEKYRLDLEKRIRNRLKKIRTQTKTDKQNNPDSQSWSLEHIQHARQASIGAGRNGGTEIFLSMQENRHLIPIREINQACKDSPISQFGRRIGMYWTGNNGKPKPRNDGIVAEIKDADGYDYWAVNKYGDFYQNNSYLEDLNPSKALYLDNQIWRVREALHYCVNLYTRLRYKQTDVVKITIRNWGLKGRSLSMHSPLAAFTLMHKISEATDSEATLVCSLEDIELNLFDNIKRLCEPTFELFDFFKPEDIVYQQLIDKFRQQFGI